MKNLLALILLLPFVASAQTADILIRNAKIIDGTGNPWFYGDVAIRKDRIMAIGDLVHLKARRTIDARKQVVAPGFIDVHTHIEGEEKKVPTADNFILDGVTTVITGNCGSSNGDMKSYFRMLDSLKMSINVASFIGHNTVRRAVLGTENREPNAEELSRMQALVAKAMKEGAVGFSTGLIYVPGTYAKTDEVVALAKAAAQYRAVYTSHIRNENVRVLEAIDEAINIGRESGMPVQISHFKVNIPSLGESNKTLALVEENRRKGFDVTIDQYPYTASSTSLNTRVPSWLLENGRDSILARLNNPATRKKVIGEMVAGAERSKRPDFSYAVVASYPAEPRFNGMSITAINKALGRPSTLISEIETILDIIAKGSAAMIFHSMDEADVENIMKYPFTMIASDSGLREFGAGVPHPRGYGTNARVLGKYVREKQVLRLEDAIRRMTSLPAQKYGFSDRGLLRTGMKADLVIFNPDEVNDESTFEKPHAYSKGFQYIFVNGSVTVDNYVHNQTRSGRVLYGKGYKSK